MLLLLVLADEIEKCNTQKNPCVFFATQNNPVSFIDPKNPLWPKFRWVSEGFGLDHVYCRILTTH